MRGLPRIPNRIISGSAKMLQFLAHSFDPREPSSYHCGNGCSFYVFETGEQFERRSYFFIVS
jgi:hypothetical protein